MASIEKIQLEGKIAELKALNNSGNIEVQSRIFYLQQRLNNILQQESKERPPLPLNASTEEKQLLPLPTYSYGSTSVLNSTTTALDNGDTFTGTEERNFHSSVLVTCYTDKEGILYLQFSSDGTNWDDSLQCDIEANKYEKHRIVKGSEYFRVVFSNTSGENQTYLRLTTYYGEFQQLNSLLNSEIAQDSDSIITRTIESEIDIAAGNYEGFSIVNKFGYNPDVDTGSTPEDIWDNGGTYTGFPSTSGETITVVSSSANDTAAGSGARTIRITGLDTNYETQTEDFTLNGVGVVTGIKTFVRVNDAYVLTSGSSNTATNAGAISIYHTTTTANIFLVIRAGTNQTASSGYTVPSGYTAYIRKLFSSIGSAGGATAAVDYCFWTQKSVKSSSPRLVRPNASYYGTPSEDNIYGGLSFTEKTDIILRVLTSAANNTPVSGGYDLLLIKNQTQLS